jgi:CRISPR-associated protein Cas2
MSRDQPRRYLVAYDVADDHRRERVAAKLSAFGDRVQYSVFVVDGRPAKLIRLRPALARLIDPASDSILICDMGPITLELAPRFEVIGRVRPLNSGHALIV